MPLRLLELQTRSNTCAQIESGNVIMPEPILPKVEELRYTSINNFESDMYFYHSDLPIAIGMGSSSWITDASGAVNQHLQYLPPDSYRDGEDFIYQRNSSWNVPYTFSAKEKDSETGYSYFGARYYDADISVWLSSDPLSDLYPSMSAYMYCAGNPVMLVDPDGRDHWKIGDDGKATLQDTKGRHIYVNGERLSKHNFTGHEEAASTIATHYYDKNFSKNKYHLANGKISIASFKKDNFDRNSSYNVDDNYNPDETSYATAMPGKGNSDEKNRINLFLVDGHMNSEFDNKYNLINCLSHERVHLIQGATSSSTRNELQAYFKMMTHWSWSNTDGRFRSDMEGNVNEYISNLWSWGYFRGGVKHDVKKYSQYLYHYYVKLFSPLMEVIKPE